MNRAGRSGANYNGRGFTLVEVVISAALLMTGLVSLLVIFGICIAATQDAQSDLIARQEAVQAIESIFTARNTSQISWTQIQNTADGGIFLGGPQTLLTPGPDGLVGTADDTADPSAGCAGPARCTTAPGRDGVLGNADDVQLPLNTFTRTIQIQPVALPTGNTNPYLRLINVTIQYRTTHYRSMAKTYSASAYISQFR